MAKEKRPFPRFLYSNPRNTKSPGPFIVHTLFPRAVFKLFKYEEEAELPEGSICVRGGEYHTLMVDCEPCSIEDQRTIVRKAHEWYSNQPERFPYTVTLKLPDFNLYIKDPE